MDIDTSFHHHPFQPALTPSHEKAETKERAVIDILRTPEYNKEHNASNVPGDDGEKVMEGENSGMVESEKNKELQNPQIKCDDNANNVPQYQWSQI